MEIISLVNDETLAESTPVSWEEWWTYDGISGKPSGSVVYKSISLSIILPVV